MPIIVDHPLARVEFPDGTSSEDINATLAELEAQYGPEIGMLEAAGTGFRQGVTSTARGIEQALPEPVREFVYGEGEPQELDREEFAREFQTRVAEAQDPIATLVGRFAGDILDPVGALLPFQKIEKVTEGLGKIRGTMAAGAGAGAVAGAAEPTFEELGDSAVFNILAGTGFGAGLGGVIGALAKRGARQVEEPEVEAPVQPREPAEPEVSDVVEQLQPEMPELIPTTPEFKLEPMLPSFRKATPKLDNTRVTFENDFDRALYMAGKGGKNATPMKNYVKRVTGLDDETVDQLAKVEFDRIRKKVIRDRKDKPDLKTIPIRSSQAFKRIIGTKIQQNQAQRQKELADIQKVRDLAQKSETRVVGAGGSQAKTTSDVLKSVREAEASAGRGGSVGAARVSPLRQRPERTIPERDIQKAFEGAPEAPVAGRAKPFLESEELNNFFSQMRPVIARGSRVATGRAERQGMATESALTRAGSKRAAEIARQSGSLNDYFTALKQADAKALDPEDIVASAPVQAEADQVIREVVDDYNNLLTRYGSADKIPAEIQRDIVEKAFNSIATKQIISGSLTRASDLMNAQKLVNKARRSDEAIEEMLGQRCF